MQFYPGGYFACYNFPNLIHTSKMFLFLNHLAVEVKNIQNLNFMIEIFFSLQELFRFQVSIMIHFFRNLFSTFRECVGYFQILFHFSSQDNLKLC